MHIEIPYGKGVLPLDVPDKNLLDVVVPKCTKGVYPTTTTRAYD